MFQHKMPSNETRATSDDWWSAIVLWSNWIIKFVLKARPDEILHSSCNWLNLIIHVKKRFIGQCWVDGRSDYLNDLSIFNQSIPPQGLCYFMHENLIHNNSWYGYVLLIILCRHWTLVNTELQRNNRILEEIKNTTADHIFTATHKSNGIQES